MTRLMLLKWMLAVAVLLFLAAIVVPFLPIRRHYYPYCSCAVRLKVLDMACREAAESLGKKPGEVLSWEEIEPYLSDADKKRGYHRTCPEGGMLLLPKVGEQPTCSKCSRSGAVSGTSQSVTTRPVDE